MAWTLACRRNWKWFARMVRDFAENEVEPSAALRDEEERFDRTLFDKMGELGLTGIPWTERLRWAWLRLCDLLSCCRGTISCVRFYRYYFISTYFACGLAYLYLWDGGAEDKFLTSDGRREEAWGIWSDRDRFRLRCRIHRNNCHARWGSLCIKRLQKIHYQCRRCGHLYRVRFDGPFAKATKAAAHLS